MPELILDPLYWKGRLHNVPDDCLHHAIFKCPREKWDKIEAAHTKILNETIRENDSVIDIGCGYGRLLRMMRREWHGGYLGVDLSPDFIEMARTDYPKRVFCVADLTKDMGQFSKYRFEWAVMISIRPMVINNLGGKVWETMEKGIRGIAKKLLFLEYDENHKGSIE